MDFHELIKNKESIRNYDQAKPVDDVAMNKILEAGCLAVCCQPSTMTFFDYFFSRDAKKKVRPCYSKNWFHDTSFVVVRDINKS